MPEIVRAFLSNDEVASLRTLAEATPSGWTAGRQGTGYDTLALREHFADHPLVTRARGWLGSVYEDYWDAYLIRYLDGAHMPDHVDVAQHGRRHRRLNALIVPPERGGELQIDGASIDLAVGDAVLFDPDREVHRVSRVVGTRMLFSVGAWI